MHRAFLALIVLITLVAPVRAADSRLAQKVAYQGGYKRLHAVAEELSKQTGVTIRCGSSARDWQVRDIPLVVCVKDMPLGELLRTVADCAHVEFASEKIANANDDETAYRLYRTKKQQEDITDALDAQTEANLKLATWAWDTLVAYAKMPDASADIPTTKPDGWTSVDAAQIRAVAETLADLGPENREKALAGEQVSAKIGASPKSAGLRNVYEYALAHDGDFMMGTRQTPTESERERSMIALRITRRDQPTSSGGFGFYVYGVPVKMAGRDDGFHYMDTWNTNPVLLAKVLASTKKLKFAPPPDSATGIDVPESFPRSGFKPLDKDDDWKLPMLQQSVNLKLSEDEKERLWPPNVLVALAKATGMNVICEDFFSHRVDPWRTVSISPNTKTSAAQVLQAASKKKRRILWYLNEESNLVAGWSWQWRKRHQALVPESLVARIHDKCAADGAELDDLVPLFDLSREQVSEWFCETPDFMSLETDVLGGGIAMWRIYGSLTAEDKLLAKSDAGLPLAKFDANWLVRFFAQVKEEAEARTISFRMPGESPRQAPIDHYTTDSKLISSLTMRVRPQPSGGMCIIRLVDERGEVTRNEYRPSPSIPEKHSYKISLETSKDPDLDLSSTWSGVGFPLYTPQRETQLRKKAESNSEEKKSVGKQ